MIQSDGNVQIFVMVLNKDNTVIQVVPSTHFNKINYVKINVMMDIII